jgi:hypothetical protein
LKADAQRPASRRLTRVLAAAKAPEALRVVGVGAVKVEKSGGHATVGYGDVVPQDTVGRAIASLLLLGGLALLSVVTATITSGFVARAQRETPSDVDAELLVEIRQLRAQVDKLGERLDR